MIKVKEREVVCVSISQPFIRQQVYWDNKDAKKELEKLRQKPLWRQLKAVQQNRIYFVDAAHWHAQDILAMNAVLDDLEKYLINPPVAGQ